MSQEEVVHAIFYKHQTISTCTGMYACNCTHRMEKTVHTVSLIQPVLFQEIAPIIKKCWSILVLVSKTVCKFKQHKIVKRLSKWSKF